MRRYARISQDRVVEFFETDGDITQMFPPSLIWVEITGNTQIQQGWVATKTDGVWTFAAYVPPPPTEQELREQAELQKWQLLNVASGWLLLNSLQFKADTGVATPEDETLLLAHKQYCIAVSDIDKQSGYPVTIDWPVVPY
ncbi:tail fiber assembly protein [Pseudomonas frederiksbergensis]|uniref:Phage tail protein n=1 Tax=Pseudomonas frederiksbergensis TaxID=104087 RepID=A0A423KM32_9PSED|nr:tail fiber assembly protein [Pseudomonas frederiksbergensis]RON54943.1 phage tail protein [Pseudomonas frederiksbergensis]